MDYIQLAFDLLGNPWIRGVVGLIVVGVIFFSAIVMVWLERKFLGDIQTRPGPNRVGGRFGLLQLVADAIKLFTKEDIVPQNADKPVHAGGPIVALTSAFLMAVAIPYGVVSFGGSEHLLAVTTMDISALYVEAVAAVSIIALFMAGWGSNNKYSLLGAFRNIARMLGYEVPLGLAVLSVAVMAQSLDFVQIVSRQEHLAWFIFMQPLGFIVFGVALLADLGRIPFDQIEAEEELIAGVFTEYSSMRWGFAFFAEYLHSIVGACLVVILFLGGWTGLPFLGTLFIPPVLWFVGKVFVVLMVMIWIRGALPRVRIDQVTDLGWKVLFPYSLINLVWAAAVAMVVS